MPFSPFPSFQKSFLPEQGYKNHPQKIMFSVPFNQNHDIFVFNHHFHFLSETMILLCPTFHSLLLVYCFGYVK